MDWYGTFAQRLQKPSYSYLFSERNLNRGEKLFQKIDKQIREILKRRIALLKLEDYEDSIVSTFSDSPDTVYIKTCPSSYDRMLIHGVSQYLCLNSKSKSTVSVSVCTYTCMWQNFGQCISNKVQNKRFFEVKKCVLKVISKNLKSKNLT